MKKFLATAAVLGALFAGSIGAANAQSSTTPTTMANSTTLAPPVDGPGCDGHGRGFAAHAETIAKSLGMTSTELQTAMQSGKSIATIAKEKGVDVQKIISALVAEEQAEHPDKNVADITQRVTDRVNGVAPTGGPMGGRHGGRGPRGGAVPTAPASTSSATSSATSTASTMAA